MTLQEAAEDYLRAEEDGKEARRRSLAARGQIRLLADLGWRRSKVAIETSQGILVASCTSDLPDLDLIQRA